MGRATSGSERARVGVLGGTFNPPHIGHLVCAQEAYAALGLDRVLVIPAGVPPHKREEPEPGSAHRLAMCRCAVAGDPRFTVETLEIDRPGPSYTVDTLRQLSQSLPDTELFWIVGGDAAADLPGWHEPEEILALSTLAVARRRGTPKAEIVAALSPLEGGGRTEFFRMPRIGISSTEIRDRVAAGEPVRYLVPDAVADYIAEHRLYGDATT